MKQIKKYVSVDELYNILLRKSKKPVSLEDFKLQLMKSFLVSPTLEFRYHDREKAGVDLIYVLDHKEIAKAIEEKQKPPALRL